MKRWLKIRGVLFVLVLVAAGTGAWWLAQPAPLLPEAQAALRSTPPVSFYREPDALAFTPATSVPRAGLVFYPGGRVSPEAYAPAAVAIAAQGYAVFIVPMPFNLAVFGSERAGAVQAAHPEIRRWVIGGHSLGGSMAAEYAAHHAGAVQGVLFWASYRASTTSLAALPLRVVSVYGTLDAGRPTMDSRKTRALLPADTRFVPIAGGNHEQMGYYTGQPNEPPATIARAAQQAQVVRASLELLDAVAAR